MASRREVRHQRALVRLDEITAMQRLIDEHKVSARSSRQVSLGLYPDLPWIGDIAETYGISLMLPTDTLGDERAVDFDDLVEQQLAAVGIVDDTEHDSDEDDEP